MNDILTKIIAPGAIFLAWMGSFEWRLKGKIDKSHFSDAIGELRKQNDRMEGYLRDIMQTQGIKATREPPEEIKKEK